MEIQALKDNHLIAVSQADESTGAVVYWALEGAVKLETLQAAWDAEMLDAALLPEPPSAEVAFRRAVQEQAESNLLVRKHPQGGFSFVYERREGGKLSYDVGVRVFLNDAGEIEADGISGLTDYVKVSYARTRQELSAVDISAWLVDLVSRRLKGVPLRDRGGVYFVPKQNVALLKQIKRALCSVTAHTVHEIPAMSSKEAIEAVLEAIRREASTVVAEIENETQGDEVSRRVAGNRIAMLHELSAKVNGYERLLGVSLNSVTDRINALVARLSGFSTRFNNLEV